MDRIITQLEELSKYISKYSFQDDSVSQVNVGCHIGHSLLSIVHMIDALKKSDPTAYQKKFGLMRVLILKGRIIPRAKVTAPNIVLPKRIVHNSQEELGLLLEKTYDTLQYVKALNPNAFLEHPVLGSICVEETLQFIGVHNHHHIKIIRDILKKQS